MQPSLLDQPERHIADTSRAAYDHVRETLQAREFAVLFAVYGYLERTGHRDVTGKELADAMGVLATTTRPRLHALARRGLLVKQPTRASRAPLETNCHPYAPTLPRAAVERAMHTGIRRTR
jgi:DNA-binding MarR family transcriptional regulator